MVIRPGRLLNDLGEGDREGVDSADGTMGLRGLSGHDSGMGMLAGCMLVFSTTVKSLVTQRMLCGMTGVPKDC
jgi:hypothetical protein